MDISYSNADDLLCVRFSDAPVAKDVAYGGNVSVGYDAEGQLAEIAILYLSSLLAREAEEDDATLGLTARESLRLADLTENPPQRSTSFLAARARYRQRLRSAEPAIDDDAYAWMTRQVALLRGGVLNEIQRERLTEFFEYQAAVQRQDVEALVRRLLVDRWTFDHLVPDGRVVQRLREFQARARDALQVSPSLRDEVTARLEAIWNEARMALNHSPQLEEGRAQERPEKCPYAIEQLLVDVAPKEPTVACKSNGSELSAGVIAHITPVGGNIFLDLGFPPDEAERLKEESDRRISSKNGDL